MESWDRLYPRYRTEEQPFLHECLRDPHLRRQSYFCLGVDAQGPREPPKFFCSRPITETRHAHCAIDIARAPDSQAPPQTSPPRAIPRAQARPAMPMPWLSPRERSPGRSWMPREACNCIRRRRAAKNGRPPRRNLSAQLRPTGSSPSTSSRLESIRLSFACSDGVPFVRRRWSQALTFRRA